MDMINWMALQGQTEEISHAVQSLSCFYKLTLSRKKGISTIARELEHVTIYVQLQNMRYHDSIELITDIPDELSEYQIPKLTPSAGCGKFHSPRNPGKRVKIRNHCHYRLDGGCRYRTSDF